MCSGSIGKFSYLLYQLFDCRNELIKFDFCLIQQGLECSSFPLIWAGNIYINSQILPKIIMKQLLQTNMLWWELSFYVILLSALFKHLLFSLQCSTNIATDFDLFGFSFVNSIVRDRPGPVQIQLSILYHVV